MQNMKSNLDGLVVPIAHVQRNIRAVVTQHPEWMEPRLAQAIAAIFERHAISMRGLRSGFRLVREKEGLTKHCPFKTIDLYLPEFSNCEVSETLNAWAEGAQKALTEAPTTSVGDVEIGMTVVFYEMNATHTHAVRVWKLQEVFPYDTGILDAQFDLDGDHQRDAALSSDPSILSLTFHHDQRGAQYNTEALKMLASELIKNGPPSQQGYAEPIVPGGVYVFAIDEHDPDPKATVDFVKHEVNNRGVNVVVLNPEVKDLLRQGGLIDFEQLKSLCVSAPTWDEISDPGIPPVFPSVAMTDAEQQVEDLRFRERCLGEAAGSLQSQYWNYMHELSVTATTSDTGVDWYQGGRVMKMPTNAIELLHKKLDELGILTADELRAQSWQPTHFPKVNDRMMDPLQLGDCAIQDRVASIQIPPQLRDTEVRRSDSPLPYGTAYQSEPGNEAPPGWKAPSIDTDDRSPSSQADSDSAQSSD